MWGVVSTLLFVVASLVSADPQGYDYLPPSQPFDFPGDACKPIISVVYSTAVQRSVVPTTQVQYETQYATSVVYSQRVVPTTQYQTQYQTRVAYETSVVEKQTQVQREQVVTRSNQLPAVYQTKYETSVRIVPQVSYVVKEEVRTQVVPVERTNIRYETKYQDQVNYQTVPVQQTSILRVPGQPIYSTAYKTEYQTSVVPRQLPDETKYATTTLVRNQINTQTVPSPPRYVTSYVQSQVVIPTVVVRTDYQTVFVTQTQYVTSTQYEARTQVQTQVVPQEVVVTRDVPREVLRTQYTTQVVPQVQIQTRVNTQYNTAPAVQRTERAYATSIVRVPGADQYVTKEVVDTQQKQQVVYKTEIVQRQNTVTQTVNVPCAAGGYNYQAPDIKFNF